MINPESPPPFFLDLEASPSSKPYLMLKAIIYTIEFK